MTETTPKRPSAQNSSAKATMATPTRQIAGSAVYATTGAFDPNGWTGQLIRVHEETISTLADLLAAEKRRVFDAEAENRSLRRDLDRARRRPWPGILTETCGCPRDLHGGRVDSHECPQHGRALRWSEIDDG